MEQRRFCREYLYIELSDSRYGEISGEVLRTFKISATAAVRIAHLIMVRRLAAMGSSRGGRGMVYGKRELAPA
jgi:hypothetical protein